MKKKAFSVAIAGAGPAGLLLARDLARAGIQVTVYEKRKKSAKAHDWSDAIEYSVLRDAGFAMPVVEAGNYRGRLVKKTPSGKGLFEKHVVNPLQIWAPDFSCKTAADVDFGYILTDRIALDEMLRAEAVKAGAVIRFEHEAAGLLGKTGGGLDTIRVEGLRVKNMKSGKISGVPADVTVDATGMASTLRTTISASGAVERPFTKSEVAYACRTVRRLDRKKLGPNGIPDHYRYGAHRGYFWTHLHDDETIDVGGGVTDEPGRVDPLEVIKEIIDSYPAITAKELRKGGGRVLVGRSPWSLVASGFLAIGDAAGQVIPTTGCGVGAGLVGAMLAAKAIAGAALKGDSGIGALWDYNRRWFVESGRGANLAALGALKDILQNLSHEELAFLIRRDILSGEMLTPSINGVFYAPDQRTMVTTLVNGISRPALLMKLSRATGIGRKVHAHYRRYPGEWNEREFARWMKEAARIFSAIK
ncbi:MAG: NAD(P)/FAD-dependent oxidoreductase [Spirochaetes bacterium]|jgi:flavin-dependent dehydrogenase|nr:NAD(P)/FAD-dependent oxidoreductase [Spirochaetota bacterium]